MINQFWPPSNQYAFISKVKQFGQKFQAKANEIQVENVGYNCSYKLLSQFADACYLESTSKTSLYF